MTSFCALVDPCCANLSGGASSCASNLRQSGVTSDETVQAACIAELTSLSQSGSCAPERWDLSDPCVRAINEPSGPQAPGSPCTSGADCAGAPGTVTMCGFAPPESMSCVQATRGVLGDRPCVGDILADGSTHLFPLGNAVTPLISSGVVCEEKAGLYCDQTTDPTAPACAAVLAEGSPLSLDCGVRRRELSRLLPCWQRCRHLSDDGREGRLLRGRPCRLCRRELVRPRQHGALRSDRGPRRRLRRRLRVHGRLLPEANSECLHLHDRRGQFLERDLRRHVLTRSVYPQVAVLGWRRDHHLARACD